MMPRTTNCEIDVADVLQWVQLACDAPRVLGAEVRRGTASGNVLKQTNIAVMKCTVRFSTSLCPLLYCRKVVGGWSGMR